MSKYSVGLRNVGSYMVSGQPYITGSAVNTGTEVKIEFPFVTKVSRFEYLLFKTTLLILLESDQDSKQAMSMILVAPVRIAPFQYG